jgi:hypothetical protein
MSGTFERGFSAEDHAVAEFAEGAVLVDLRTGAYFQLNRSALAVFRAVQQTRDRSAAASRISEALGLSIDDALAAADDLVAGLSAAPPRHRQQERFEYAVGPTGYDLLYGDRAVLHLATDGKSVVLPTVVSDDAPSVGERLRAAAPKLLSLQGVRVLHAAACEVGDGLLGFSGLSGAGKTTTARAFAALGPRLVSEDIVVISPHRGDIVEAYLDAEPATRDWARRRGDAGARAGAVIACADLASIVANGPTRRLERVLFLDRTRRSGLTIRTRRLSAPEALLALMTSNFLASADAGAWRHYLAEWTPIAQAIEALEATVPPTLDLLGAAMRAYSDSAAS